MIKFTDKKARAMHGQTPKTIMTETRMARLQWLCQRHRLESGGGGGGRVLHFLK